MTLKLTRSSLWPALALVIVTPLLVSGATPKAKSKTEAPPAIGLFEGVAAGEIEVAVIPKDSTEGTVTIKNKTNKPLTIKMPEAIAAVPILAQAGGLGGGGMGGMGGGGMGGGGGGGMQSMGMGGGGMGGGGMGGGMGGMGGGGNFSVAPEKVVKVKMPGVCLEHGLKDPNPRVPYKLVPIESFAKSSAVTEVVKMLGRGELDQHTAQAATWHLQNDLSWEELANKIGAKHLNGAVEPYFTVGHLQRAHTVVRVAEERAKSAPQPRSPTTSTSPAAPSRSLSENLTSQR